MNKLRYVELFAGVGGFRLGIEKALNNLEPVCVFANEYDKYAAATYDKNFGGSIDTRDITTVPARGIPHHDLICGGFPCQAFSVAGKQRGFQETRGTLFFEIMRIARHHRTPYLFLENVKGLLSHEGGRTFATIIATLDELGYDCQWQVLNSKHFGVPQNRERVFIVGHLRGQPRPEVFPITQDDLLPDGARPETRAEDEYISNTIRAKAGGGRGDVEEVYVLDGKPSSTRRGFVKKGYAGALETQGLQIVASAAIRGRDGAATLETRADGIANALRTGGGGQSKGMVVERAPLRFLGRNQKNADGEYSFTVDTSNTGGVKVDGRLRRLTPIECERLQGFPDNWTAGQSDTQRYKQMGNAVTVNVIEAIARRMYGE